MQKEASFHSHRSSQREWNDALLFSGEPATR